MKGSVRKFFWRCVPCEKILEDTRTLCYAWEDGFRCPSCGRKCLRDHSATRLASEASTGELGRLLSTEKGILEIASYTGLARVQKDSQARINAILAQLKRRGVKITEAKEYTK